MSQPSVCINRKLKALSPISFGPFIFKINEQLRRESKKAYEPEILSVGPYHRGKVNLQMMEEHKLRYLHELLQGEKERLDRYVEAMKKLEEEAQNCYAEPIKLNKDKFVEMMLLDGCFIIQLFRKFEDKNLRDAQDPIFQIPIIRKSIRRDLLLFENQIPLSVLVQLLETENSNQGNALDILRPLALKFFHPTISKLPCSQTSNNQPTTIPKYHLLGLVHDAWESSIAKKGPSPGTDTNHVFIKGVTKVLESVIKFKKCKNNSSPHNIDPEKGTSPVIDTNHRCIEGVTKVQESAIKSKKCKNSSSSHNNLEKGTSPRIDTKHRFIKSVTELQEFGIEFKKNECSSLLGVNFENGNMKIPSLLVDDDTEWLFRNLIAYEQHSGKTRKTYMTEYMILMDCLLNSPKDVEILRHSEIIENWLGDDKVVSTMFNKMGNYVVVSPKKFHYGKEFKKVNDYCNHRCHGWMAFLRYNYCNNPWSILSVIVASVLLLLTVIQTVCSILQV